MSTNYIAPIWRMPKNNNNGKLSNYSINIGAAGEYVDTNTSLDTSYTSLSLSAWVKYDSLIDYEGTLFGQWITNAFSSSTLLAYVEPSGPNKVFKVYWGPTTSNPLVSTTTLQTDVWYHIVITWDGNNIKLFIDGAEEDSQVKTSINNSTQTLKIGAYINAAQTAYIGELNGQVSQACLFDYALDFSQVTYLYNKNNPMAISGGEPTAYWPLGDNSNPNAPGSFPNISVGADSVFDFTSGEYVQLDDNDLLSFGDGATDDPMSISVWCKTTDGTGNAILSKWGGGSPGVGYEYIFWIVGPNKIRLSLYGQNTTVNNVYRQTTTDVNTGEWTHVLATYDGRGGNNAQQGIRIYLNGQEEGSYTESSTGSYQAMSNTGRSPQIGIYNTTSSTTWEGPMSNLQVWRAELNAAEALELYNNGQPLITGTQPQQSSLVAWWKLNQTANWEADAIGKWQIPNNKSAYPQSFKFNEIQDYIQGDLNLDGEKVHAVSFWIKNKQASGLGYVLSTRPSSYGPGFAFIVRQSDTTGYIFSNVRDTPTTTQSNATGYQSALGIPQDDNWHHVVFTHAITTGQLKAYIDGVFKYERLPQTRTDSNTINPLKISSNQSVQDFGGHISNVMVWEDVVLTDGNVGLNDVALGEIAQLYNNGVPITSASVQSDKLKGWYKLDNTEIFDGTNWEVENQAYPANYENALNFGTRTQAEYIALNQLPLYNAITVSAWIKTQKNGSSRQTIISNSQPNAVANEKGWQLAIDQAWSSGYTKAGFVFYDSTGSTAITIAQTSSQELTDNKWHHVVALWDGTTNTNAAKIFVDGLLAGQGTSSFAGPIGQPVVGLEPRIGTQAYSTSGGGNNFGGDGGEDGFISNIQTWDSSLTYGTVSSIGDTAGGQIADLYNNGTPVTTVIDETNLQCWYKLDNLTTGIQDLSNNSNNGTNNGTSQASTFVSTEAATSSGMTEQNLVNNNVSVLNGESVGMNTTNLIQSNLTKTQPFSNYSMFYDAVDVYSTFDTQISLGSSDSFTWSFWIKPVYNSISDMVLLRASATSITANNTMLLTYSGGNWRIKWDNASGNFTTGYVMPDNEWSHVALSITQGTGTRYAYINGVQDSANAAVAGITSQWLGFSSQNTTNDFEGYLSQCAYWNTNLSTTELAALYNNGVPQDLRDFSVQPTQYWPMNEKYNYWDGSNWINRDIINGNDSTMVNTAVISAFVGNAPGSDANGSGINLTITDLKGNMESSKENAYSINMADYADGVTNPANSGRSTEVPSV